MLEMRGRPRIPPELAAVTGTMMRNPERFVHRIESTDQLDHIPIGLCPPDLAIDPASARVWQEFVAEFPWLRESDRKAVELCCIVMVHIRAQWACGHLADTKWFSLMRQLLSLLGGTPSTISKVLPPAKKDDGSDKPKKGSRYLNWGPHAGSA